MYYVEVKGQGEIYINKKIELFCCGFVRAAHNYKRFRTVNTIKTNQTHTSNWVQNCIDFIGEVIRND
jgi:hypothetical protein